VHEMPSPEAAAPGKAELRRRALAARAAMPEQEREAAGRRIRDHVLGMAEIATAGTVAAYYSAGTEPDSRRLVYALWKRGTYVILPVLRTDGDLDWASYEGPESMAPGPRGLLQPTEPLRGTGVVARADAVLVPALAVDRAGNRLGRGGGSYDRVLVRVGAQVPLMALIYDTELAVSLPVASHDRPVRAVVRPGHGITRLPAGLSLAVTNGEC
jgi:5-formyltetrahydrofolate cyclo-ligase